MTNYQLQPMSTGDILDTAVVVYRQHFGVLMSIAIFCLGIPTLMFIAIALGGGLTLHGTMWFAAFILAMVGGVLAEGAVVWAVSEGYLGRTPTSGSALGAAFGRFGAIFVAGLARNILIGLALFLFFVPGVIVGAGYSVVLPVVVLERFGGGTGALGRSWELTRGYKGKALMLFLAVVVVLVIPLFAAGVVAAIIPPLASVVEAAAQVVQLVLLPAFSCVFTLFYYDLRVRKEAFDLEQLSQHLGETAGAAPA